MDPNVLIIFDYSGTLSLGAVEFGRPGSLQRQLEKSGLAKLGLDTPDRYWQVLVAPTWPAASTTRDGFKPIAVRCIQELADQTAGPAKIKSAVDKFMDAYMRHSSIDASWRPLLAYLQMHPDTRGLIATDHYAEATPAIQGHLATLGIAAIPAVPTRAVNKQTPFIIANSADIGCPKADRQFWQALEKTCLPGPFKRVVVVDDFGSNEQDQSGYADTAKIEARIAATRQALDSVFGTAPQIVHFSAGANAASAIAAARKAVRGVLNP